MSQPSVDARAVAKAVEKLTTQVRRLADSRQSDFVLSTDDGVTTPLDDATTTCGASAVTTFGPVGPCTLRAGHAGPVHKAGQSTFWRDEQAPATDEDAQRTTRRDSLGILLSRASAGLTPDEDALLRQHVEAEIRHADQLRAGRQTWKSKAEEIERDRDAIAADHDRLRDVLRTETARANAAIDREETAEQAAEEQRRRAGIFETELRVLRTGLRAAGGDPTQIQNLWAQIRLRNRQWREAKRERDEAQAAIDRVRALHTRTTVQTTGGPADACSHCETDSMSYPWPCGTTEALDGTEQPTESS